MGLVLTHRVNEGANINESIDVIVRRINLYKGTVTFEIREGHDSRRKNLGLGETERISDDISFRIPPDRTKMQACQVKVVYDAPRQYPIWRKPYPI